VILVEERGAYLGGEPATDGRFLASFAHALEHTGGYTSAEAKRMAATLLPDILPYDSSRPASFPDNGRKLTDDAHYQANAFPAAANVALVDGDIGDPRTAAKIVDTAVSRFGRSMCW